MMFDMQKMVLLLAVGVVGVQPVCGGETFTEKMVSIVLPRPLDAAAAATVASAGAIAVAEESPEAKTVSVGELSIFTLRRTSLILGSTSEVVFVAPYYYAAPVTLCNPDGSPFKMKGEVVTTVAYFGMAYEGGAWKDVSGVPVGNNGMRSWTNGTYALVSEDAGGPRVLRALLAGATAQTIAYGTTSFGPENIPQLYTLSSFDVDVLTNTGLFFSGTGDTPGSLLEIQTNGYKNLAPLASTTPVTWGANTLTALSLPLDAPSTPAVVEVQIGARSSIPGAQDFLTYRIPRSMVYQVMKPTSDKTNVVVRQYYLNTLAGDEVTAGTNTVQQPFQCFVPVAVDMQLSEYYLKIPASTAGRPALFVALTYAPSQSRFIAQTPAGWSVNTTSDFAQILIQGLSCLEVEPGGAVTRQIYCATGNGAFTYQPPTTIGEYLSLVGSTIEADVKQKTAFYQQMQESYVPKCTVVAATEQFFNGQLSFYLRSLDQLKTVTQAQIRANPTSSLISLWRSALCGDNGAKVKAVLQDGTQTKELEREWSNAQNCGGMLQVRFTTAAASTAYDGMMIFSASAIAGIIPYYRTDLLSPVAQFWFSPSPGIVNQTALTFDATTLTGATIATDEQVAALAGSSGNMIAAFKAKANVFWGLIAAGGSDKKSGLSDLQKTQLGLGAGMGVLGLFGAYQWYRRRQENKY